MKKRNTPLPKFKYKIGDKFTNFNRNLEIIDRKYIQKEELNYRTGNLYTANTKYYKYKCNKCGNEDWILEYCLGDKMHIGCNACCVNARKLVVGINDITTTAPWMVKYFKGGKEEASKYFKYSKEKIEMICPDCGRIHISSPLTVFATKNLTCPCQDGWSYPNKFMYSLLEQLEIDFETEKKFDWSQGRLYDNYIEYNGLKIITEQHGNQHYDKPFNKHSRTIKEEKENDKLKESLAKENGITNYIVLNCRKSELEHIQKSIVDSGLLSLLNKTENDIDWNKCVEFATSNLVKIVCDFKKQNTNLTLHEIANKLHLSYIFVLRSVQNGAKLGWCIYDTSEDIKKVFAKGLKKTLQRPIFCKENGMYYRCARTFVDDYFEKHGKKLCERNIRSVCLGKRNHVNNMTFSYITQKEFNSIKDANPELVVGNYFKLE